MAPQVLPSGPDLSRWQRMHLFTVRENIVVCDSEPDVAVTQPSKASTQVGSLSQRQAPQFGVQLSNQPAAESSRKPGHAAQQQHQARWLRRYVDAEALRGQHIKRLAVTATEDFVRSRVKI